MGADEEFSEARARLRAFILGVLGATDLPRFDEALTHTSFANESGAPDYQRLEFLGDVVLGLCVSEMLIALHPAADEGMLTRMRSALVNAEVLAQWGRSVELGESLALGKGARAGSDREQDKVISDAVEALVAASYEAHGLDGARALVKEIVRESIGQADQLGMRDPKSLLQERVQALGHPAPVYRVTETAGPPHAQRFTVEVVIAGVVAATGAGRSKKIAERAAAAKALEAEREANGEETPA